MNWKLIRIIDRNIGIPLIGLARCTKTHSPLQTVPNIKKILLVKFWGIGNILMMTPTIQALKKHFPQASIDLLTLTHNQECVTTLLLADHVHLIDTSNISSFILTTLSNIRHLNKENYDIVIDFEQFARFSAILCFLIKGKMTIGFFTQSQMRHALFTHPVMYNNEIHITQSFFSLLAPLGINKFDEHQALSTKLIDTIPAEAQTILKDHHISTDKLVIIMHPGTSENFALRRWPPSSFARLADLLINEHDATIILTGLPSERKLTEEIASLIHHHHNIVNLAGRLNFRRFFCLLSASDLVISADTAPVHLASFLSVPVAGLYGPNTPYLYGPWGAQSLWFYKNLSCSPCITNYNAKINTCRNPEGQGACMTKITVEEVFSGLQKNYFDKNAPHRLKKNHSL